MCCLTMLMCTKGILLKHPLDLPFEAVLDHPNILTTKRLCTTRDKAQTCQVLIELKGPLLERLDQGLLGRYSLCPYDKEPLWCYKCQRYKYLQTCCPFIVRHRVCSQAHLMEECIRRHKNKATTSYCPNYLQKHHAWNLHCLP